MLPLEGSILDAVPVRLFATHTAFPVATTACGPLPTKIGGPTTSPVRGSIRDTVPSPEFATQTAPAPDASAVGRAPTATWPISRCVFRSISPTEFASIEESAPLCPDSLIGTITATATTTAAPAATSFHDRRRG